MTNRYKPNEAACPVPLTLLALLVVSREDRVAEIVQELPVLQRAALAAFAYGRCHLRDLAFQIAPHCERHALYEVAGPVGEVIFEQSRERDTFDPEPRIVRTRKVTLARMAA